jgi:hypothetical protein
MHGAERGGIDAVGGPAGRMTVATLAAGHAVTSSRTGRALRSETLSNLALLEYVIVHEMAHLIEPTHSERVIEIIDKHYPTWREARAELNELPLAAEGWNE